MMKFICPIFTILVLVISYFSPVQAQDQGVDTVWLSVESNRIKVDSSDITVNQQGIIVFCTTDNFTFTVFINNYDQFIDNPVTFLTFNVAKDNPVTITVGSPPKDDNIKVYSVGTVGKKVPLPPESPPRIIIKRTE